MSRDIFSRLAPLTLGIAVACSSKPVDSREAIPLTDSTLSVLEANGGAFPRVFDVKTKKTLFASETARGAIFWPKPTVQR